MNTNSIRVSFDIYNFNSSTAELTKKIGIKPTEESTKGEVKYLGLKENRVRIIVKENRWSLASQGSDSLSLEEHLKHLLAQLIPFKHNIKQSTKGCKKQFNCALEFKESRPGIHLDKAILEEITALGAELDLDIYFFEEDSLE